MRWFRENVDGVGLALFLVVMALSGMMGWLAWSSTERTERGRRECLAAKMQWVEGSCVR